MALSIKDPETDELARRLAEATGDSLTGAVRRALRAQLEREQRARQQTALSSRLLEIGRRCAAQVPQPFHSTDHDALLYDERGLPR